MAFSWWLDGQVCWRSSSLDPLLLLLGLRCCWGRAGRCCVGCWARAHQACCLELLSGEHVWGVGVLEGLRVLGAAWTW